MTPVLLRFDMPHLTRDQRIQVLTLHAAGFSHTKIAQQLKITLRQAQYTCRLGHPSPKKRSGRPRVLSDDQVQDLVTFVGASPENKMMSYAELAEGPFKRWGVSKDIICRTLTAQGFRRLIDEVPVSPSGIEASSVSTTSGSPGSTKPVRRWKTMPVKPDTGQQFANEVISRPLGLQMDTSQIADHSSPRELENLDGGICPSSRQGMSLSRRRNVKSASGGLRGCVDPALHPRRATLVRFDSNLDGVPATSIDTAVQAVAVAAAASQSVPQTAGESDNALAGLDSGHLAVDGVAIQPSDTALSVPMTSRAVSSPWPGSWNHHPHEASHPWPVQSSGPWISWDPAVRSMASPTSNVGLEMPPMVLPLGVRRHGSISTSQPHLSAALPADGFRSTSSDESLGVKVGLTTGGGGVDDAENVSSIPPNPDIQGLDCRNVAPSVLDLVTLDPRMQDAGGGGSKLAEDRHVQSACADGQAAAT